MTEKKEVRPERYLGSQESVVGPSADEIDEFVVENRRWLSDEAEEILRNMDGADQMHVVAEGSMSNCRDSVAIVKSRAWNGHLKAHRDWMEARRDLGHDELLNDFIAANTKWMNDEAEGVLREMSRDVLWGVIDFGSLAGCRDPTAILRIRARDVGKGKTGKSCGKKGKGEKKGGGNSKVTDRIYGEKGPKGKGPSNDGHGALAGTAAGGKGSGKDVMAEYMAGKSKPGFVEWLDILKGKAGKGFFEFLKGKKGKGPSGLGKDPLRSWQDSQFSGNWEDDYGSHGNSPEAIDDMPGNELEEEEDEETAKERKKMEEKESFAARQAESKEENMQAVEEGRCMYCVGLPPLWSTQQINEFFAHQGEVISVHLMNVQKGKNNRAAYINFKETDGATNAALVCDRLEIDDRNEKFVLSCSVKQKAGARTYGRKFSFPARGMVDPRQAQTEMRTIFISKLPLEVSQEQVQVLCENFGEVEGVHMLPPNQWSAAAFVTMVSPGEAATMMRSLNNSQAFGTFIATNYPVEKDHKRRKPHPEDETIQWYPLEIRNFPHWTVIDDLKATIETVGPKAQRVRVMHYDDEPSMSVARAYFAEEGDRDEVLKTLAGYEFTPGFALMVMALARTSGTGPGFAPQPPLQFGEQRHPGIPLSAMCPALATAQCELQFSPAFAHSAIPAAFMAGGHVPSIQGMQDIGMGIGMGMQGFGMQGTGFPV